jgi:WD40 repeat protein
MAFISLHKKITICAMLLFLLGISSLAGCTAAQENPNIPTASPTSLATPTLAGLPDLTIVDVRLDITPEELCTNAPESYGVLIQIKNQGKSDAGPFAVSINQDQLRFISDLRAGEILELSTNSSTLELNIAVDPRFEVSENNENNNHVITKLALPTDQDLCTNTIIGNSVEVSPIFTLEGHSDKVFSVDFSPDGNLIASGSIDNTLRLWRATLGTLLRTMRGHPFPVLATKFSSNGSILATGSTDGIIRIWRVSDGRLLQEMLGHAGRVKSLDLSTDGRYLVSCADDFTVRLWRLIDYRLVQTIDEGMLEITSVAFSPDNQTFAWTEINGIVRVRTVSGNWLHVFNETPFSANAVAFDPQGEWISAGFADGSIRIWEVLSGESTHILKSHAQAINDLEFSPDGNWLASASRDGTIHLWQRDEKGFGTSPTLILSGHISSVNSISFSPDGIHLASASDDYRVLTWEIPQED